MSEVPARLEDRARGLRRLRGGTTRRAGRGVARVSRAVHNNHESHGLE
jgi:hypothetical protein